MLAEPNGPTDPNKGVRSVTTLLNGGNATAGAIADPNGGIGAQIGTGNSRRTPGARQQGPASRPDPFAQLVARLAQQACSAARDTIIFEQPVGASNGFTCVAPTGSSTPDSLAGFALGAESSIRWPRIAIGANPNDPATVAVPTYYWVSGYDGSPRSVGITAVVQEGERCTPTFETNPDGPQTQTGQDCFPNLVTYRVTVTARPTTFSWNFGDNQRNPTKDGQQSVVTKAGLEGLGTPYQAPTWSSPIMHLFNVSSYRLEAEGGFPITLTVTYQVDWEAGASATGERQSGSLGSLQQTVARPQRVQEIQVLRGASAVRCQEQARC
ncbi:MAG: hypothetical protein M3069_03025 [Chloroflexota bacterium]|nr:hypothetical protein [Chloroflexota bacterium]